jgi:RHS repeat-associated protein
MGASETTISAAGLNRRRRDGSARLLAGAILLGLGQAALAGEAPPPMAVSGTFDVGATGAATYTIPIAVPPGTAGLAPNLSLGYSSQSGNGILGFGWSLSGLPSIARCPRTMAQDGVHGGVNYDANDRFCLNGQRLLVINGGTYGADGSEYRTEIESFSRVIAHNVAGVTGPGWFEVHTKSGQIIELGNTADSRVLATGTSTARVWAADKISDLAGNYLAVAYVNDTVNGQYYPDHILYTGNTAAATAPYNSVYFSYTTRSDVTPLYHAGSMMQTTKLLSDIKTYTNTTGTGTAVTDYKLAYQLGNAPYSQLASLTRCDGAGTCLAPTSFGWQTATTWPGRIVVDSTPPTSVGAAIAFVPYDFNGDGLPDAVDRPGVPGYCPLLYVDTPGTGFVPSGMTESYGGLPPKPACLETSPPIPPLPSGAVGDFNGDGLADMTEWSINPDCICVLLNDGAGHFSEAPVGDIPMLPGYGADYDGDGRDDFINSDYTNGTYTIEFSRGDGSFVAGPVHAIGGTAGNPALPFDMPRGDFDGDGCIDLAFENGANEIQYSCQPAVPSVAIPNFYNVSNVYSGDFNGDGLTDFVSVPNNGSVGSLYLSTGISFLQSALAGVKCGGPTGCLPLNQYFVGDFDGDGKMDLLMVEQEDFKVFTWNGTTLSVALTVNVELPQPNCNDYCTKPGWNGMLEVGDMDGDGCTDLVVYQPFMPTISWYYKFGCHPPLLMTSISNGIGASTTISYDRLNKNQPLYTKCPNNPGAMLCGDTYPTQAVDGPIYVVEQVDTSNGLGVCTPVLGGNGANCFTTTYTYGGAKRDLSGRGFLGFQQIVATDHQTNAVQTTRYNTLFPLTGTVLEQTRTVNGGATVLSDTVNSYGTIPAILAMGTPTFVYTAASTTSGHEVDNSALPATTTTNSNFDGYGDAQTVTVAVSDGSSKTTTNTYCNLAAACDDTPASKWIVGRLTDTVVTSSVGSSTITRESSFAYDPATGILKQEVIEPNATGCLGTGAACRLETDYVLDAFGHRKSATVRGAGFAARTSSVGYDANGTFATATANALGQSDAWDYTGPYGAGLGVPTGHTDLNGLVTSWTYDSFGRRTLEALPGTNGGKTASAYLYCSGVNGGTAPCPVNGAYLLQTTPYNHNGTTQNGPIAIAYYDALSRLIATDVEGFDGPSHLACGNPCWVRTQTQYGPDGTPAQTSRPYFLTGGTAQWTTNDDTDPLGQPDPYGRPWTVTYPDASVTRFVYTGLGNGGEQTTLTDALGHSTTTAKNAQNLVSSSTNALGKTTQYTYDAYGDLSTVTDPKGDVIAYTFDVRGNRLSASDPDMGLWHYSYDALGELVSQTDAKGQSSTLAYDTLGRMTARTEPDQTSTWTYDTAVHGVGKLAQATGSNAGYSRSYLYDSQERPSRVTLAVNGASYLYKPTYNSDSRLDTLGYPSGFVVKYVYTARGYLQQLQDVATGAVLWTANARDAEQHLVDQTAGAARTFAMYNPQTGLVQQIRASADGSDDGTLAHLDYWFDAVGNLTSRDDTIAPYTERFCYDPLNRLTNYSIGGADCRSGTPGLVKSVAYDDLGNIVSKSDLAVGGSGAYTYPTPGSGAVRPHAVTSIAGTVNGIAGPSYKYDGNGNLVCVYTGTGCAGGGIVRESDQVWSFNMAKTVTEGTNSAAFVYDSEHSRITQTLTAGSTVTTTTYLNDPVSGLFEERVATGGVTAWNDYLTVDGKLVAERMCTGPTPCSTGATVQDFVTDHLGSVAVVVGTSGALVARESFDVWGRERNADGTDDAPCALGSSAPTTRGFTGQEDMPAFCLLNLNARLYDPTIGRMMSADSVIPNPTDGQSFNRYTYVDNRPLSLTDPTGHEPDFQWNFEFADDPGASCFGDCGTGGGVGGQPTFVDVSSDGEVIAHLTVTVNSNGTPSMNVSCSEGVDCDAAKNAIADKLGSAETGTPTSSSPNAVNQTASAQNVRPNVQVAGGTNDDESSRRGGGLFDLDPTAEVRAETFDNNRANITRLDPNNRLGSILTNPDSIPSSEQVRDSERELEAVRDRVSRGIASGHAYEKHGAEFGNIDQAQFQAIVRSVLSDPFALTRDLSNGRSAFYNLNTNTLVIVNPSDPDMGTTFRPTGGLDYFNNVLR